MVQMQKEESLVRFLWITISAAVMVALDQWTKALTVAHIPLGGEVPFWDGVFHFTHFQNTGMAFSMLEGARWILLVLTATMIAALLVAVYKRWIYGFVGVSAVALVVGGGLGNLIDRAWLGYVVDMIELDFMDFAIFNVADCFVCVGAALLVVWVLFLDRKKGATK